MNAFALLPAPLQLAAAALGGLVFGSFLNVLVHRLPRDQSPWTGRSRCPKCERIVRWYENIPVLSFAALRGRCAGCRAPIGWRYPLVEIATALLGIVCVLRFGPGPAAGAYFLFLAALLAIALIDWDFQIIPDELSLGLGVVGLVLAATVLPLGLWRGLLGAAIGAGFLWGIAAAYKAARGQDGMGFGDVKMAAMIGAFLGPLQVLLTIFVAAFLGSVWGAWLMARRGGSGRTLVAFGTFLAASAALCLFWGDALRIWYAGLLQP